MPGTAVVKPCAGLPRGRARYGPSGWGSRRPMSTGLAAPMSAFGGDGHAPARRRNPFTSGATGPAARTSACATRQR